MSCPKCDDGQPGGEAHQYPYRWGRATVVLVACEEHAIEIFAALNTWRKVKELIKEESNHEDR